MSCGAERENENMTFSIIIVCLNAGEKLHETMESIRSQTDRDYEVIIKDGESADEATKAYLADYAQDDAFRERVRVYSCRDAGIYDAMNQAVRYVRGRYVFFLNCGDCLYDAEVLGRVRAQIDRQNAAGKKRCIYYGNVYECRTGALVQSNPVIDDFACYRNLPCHQACFYDAALMRERGFDISYEVRADYEHFLWCYYRGDAKTAYMPVTVTRYEGGGFSETKENERKARQEHREITGRYLPAGKLWKYRLVMLLTLAPLRTRLARNPATAGIYQTIKRKLYQ